MPNESIDDLSPVFWCEHNMGLGLPTDVRHRLTRFHESFLLRLAGLSGERAYLFTTDRQSLSGSHGRRPRVQGVPAPPAIVDPD